MGVENLDQVVLQNAVSLRQFLNRADITPDREDCAYAYLQATVGFAEGMQLSEADFMKKMLLTYQAKRYKTGE